MVILLQARCPSRHSTNSIKGQKDEIVLIITTRKCYRASVAQCKVSAYDVLERPDTAVTKLQISPVIVNGFKNGFHQSIQRIFLVVVEGKKIFFRKFFLLFSKNLDAF